MPKTGKKGHKKNAYVHLAGGERRHVTDCVLTPVSLPHMLSSATFAILMPKQYNQASINFTPDYTNCGGFSKLCIMIDVKLSDYANNPHTGAIRKKAAVSAVREINNFCALEKAWLDLESEEFENLDSDDDDGDIKFEDGVLTSCSAKKKSRHRKTFQRKDGTSGNIYPLDLWFCIGNYVDPEDVKVFAQICKGSHIVSQMYSFWMNLYRRNYQAGKQLPLSLQPHCIEKPRHLKARVIRALYHLYPKFINAPSCAENYDLHKLIKNVCVSMWLSKGTGNEWLFYFKFQSRYSNHHSDIVLHEDDPPANWMEWEEIHIKDPQVLIDEVNHNPEEDYKILQVQSPSFVAAPHVMGGCLADVRMGLTRDMTKQKLQLTFCFSNYKQSYNKRTLSIGSRDCGGNAEIVAFDPVGSVTVLDWWHPRYPLGNRL